MEFLAKLRDSDRLSCCRTAEERSQLERSQSIDRELDEYRRRYMATQKIVLLGAGESGKSTFLKQMQIIHGKGFKLEDKLIYRTQIYENILKGMAGLLNGKKELKIPWRGNCLFYYDTNNYSNSSLSSPDAKSSQENKSSSNVNSGPSNISQYSPPPAASPIAPMDVTIRMKAILNQFTVAYKTLIEERERESLRLQKRINITPDQFVSNNLVEVILNLWMDDAIRETYERRREVPKYFVENVPYFMESMERIGRKDYLPSAADILRSRRATTSINEIEMDVKGVPFRFVDVGGQRTQRQKWHQCFSDVTAILFLASASEYDEFLREDHTVNRLEESLKVFSTLVNYKHFQNVEFILFLNKHDLLKAKINRVNIKAYCKDFTGSSNSIKDVERYLLTKFTSLKPNKSHNETNKSSNAKQSSQSINRVKSNSQFDDISSPRGSTPTGDTTNNEKYIYSHFTTAIDTNNIRTIFEMVRLMIFEKNCKAIMLN